MNRFVKFKLQLIREKTEATRFLLPMLGDKYHRDNFFVNAHFMNAYIGDSNKPEYDNHILLRYNYLPTNFYLKFDKELIVQKGVIGEYDYGDNRTVMYVFKVPGEFQEDYNKFLDGKYSEFSTNYKLRILKFWSLDYWGRDNLLASILFRSDLIKKWWDDRGINKNSSCTENEYWYKPLLSTEVYHHKKLDIAR